MALNWKWTWLAAALAMAGCSKEKTDDADTSAKTPTPAAAPEAGKSAEPATESAAAAPASQQAGTLRARFDGYAPRIASGLWHPVPLTAKPAQYALLVPTAPIPAGLAGLQADGPENIAVATEGLLMETGERRPLVVGREYDFVFTQDGELWKAAITRAP